jgi:hypothetical protein
MVQPVFAPKVTKPQAKPAAEQRGFSPPRETVGRAHEGGGWEGAAARGALRRVAWDFGKIPLFSPDRQSRPQSPSTLSTTPLPGGMQAKPVVGEANDPPEPEASTVADQLKMMRVPAAAAPQALTEAPSLVRDVLRMPGQPLDPATRADFELRFGHDFSHVRVHTDSAAAQSTRDLNANAYTAGRNIVFGDGRFQPGTPAGRRLLSHELTHVVQQRRSPVSTTRDLDIPGDVHERQADAVADVLMRGGAVAGLFDSGSGSACPPLQRDTSQGNPQSAAQPANAAPPPAQPLDFDRDIARLKTLDRGVTVDSITKVLKDDVKNGAIASFAVTGFKSGSPAEIFLLAAVHAFSGKSNWGSESHVVAPIDWPVGAVTPPQGRIIVRIDPRGAASAELVGAGPVPAVAQTTFAAGSAKAIADFGFATVSGWSGRGPNDDAEISDVLAALELLKRRAPKDITALKGVELIRVPSLGGNEAGEFFAGDSAAGVKPYLKLADSAFTADNAQFYGGEPGSPSLPASFQVILHEVGHAVETEELRAAREDYDKASAEVDESRKRMAGEKASSETEYQEAKRKGTLAAYYKKQGAAHKKNEEDEQKALTHQQAAARTMASAQVAPGALQTLMTEAAAGSAAAANALTAAKAAVQTLRPDEIQGSAAYSGAIDVTAAAITQFAEDAKAGKGKIDDLELIVFQKANDRDKALLELERAANMSARNPKATFPVDRAARLLRPAADAQDAWIEAERILAHARGRSRRLQKFVDFVISNNIRRFTRYSLDQWQLHPEEFYAEAYSLWLVDPEFVKTNYKAIYDFFENGDHRN